MIYPIVKYGAPVLEQEAQPVTEFDDRLRQLVADMFESMYAAHGVGLAAPQIGIPRRLAVIDVASGQDPAAKLVLANPVIVSREGKQRGEEGCLSLPGFHADVNRPARAFCHEIDHLHGKLFIQHLSALKRDLIRRKVRKLAKAGDW